MSSTAWTASGSLIVELPADADFGGLESLEGPEPLDGATAFESTEQGETRAWRVRAARDVNPWDAAHQALEAQQVSGLEAPVRFAEPDWVQEFPFRREGVVEGLEAAAVCAVKHPSPDWAPADVDFGWHLGDDYSGLKSARERVGANAAHVRIGILDTGYDPDHATLPGSLDLSAARNFADPSNPNDARDPAAGSEVESLFENPGHGTATLGILAGARIQPPEFEFDDFLGGCPHAVIVPIRIADSVIHFSSASMAQGIAYAASIGCDVVSISMGGAPSRSWAKAVNEAYEAGTAIFAAAGNNVAGLPTRSLVYPARFHRVVAVCGATAGKEPYFKHFGYPGMQGNFGPEGKMRTAITAYTPNMPWAEINCGQVVSLDGAGTSSATPQAAAAAALWFAYHDPQPAERWRRVEAVRHALFSSADKSHAAFQEQFGNGLLRANAALDAAPDLDRPKAKKDRVWFPWLRMLFGLEAAAPVDDHEEMFEIEALQLYLTSLEAQEISGGADPDEDEIDAKVQKRVLEALASRPDASKALRKLLQERIAGL